MRRSKYNAIKCFGSDGFKYDSKKEMRFCEEKLLPLLKAGKLKSINRQVEFILQPGFKKNGKSYRAIKYIADFEVIWESGRVEIFDVKGFETEVFKIKKKLFEHTFWNKELVIVA